MRCHIRKWKTAPKCLRSRRKCGRITGHHFGVAYSCMKFQIWYDTQCFSFSIVQSNKITTPCRRSLLRTNAPYICPHVYQIPINTYPKRAMVSPSERTAHRASHSTLVDGIAMVWFSSRVHNPANTNCGLAVTTDSNNISWASR